MTTTDEKEEMKTLSSCMETLKKKGYTENFMVNDYGLHGLNSEKYYAPEEVRITDFYRFEGESDPADGAILYAIETNDGLKGQISDAYGAYADARVLKFMSDVEEIMKKSQTVPNDQEPK
jgi:hypothetical protein